MTTRLTHRPHAFPIDGAVTLRVRRAGWLRSDDGRAWLTRPQGGGDSILAPGAWQWVTPGSHWVIEPLRLRSEQALMPHASPGRPLRIEWRALPSRWASWRCAWQGFVERLSGEAASDDAARPPAVGQRSPRADEWRHVVVPIDMPSQGA
jgi:hypothetical protein